MHPLNWAIEPNHAYQFIAQTSDVVFTYKPHQIVSDIVETSVSLAREAHPLKLHCVGASQDLLEVLFSAGRGEVPNVRPFFEQLLVLLEDSFQTVWARAPQNLFSYMRLETCPGDFYFERRVQEIMRQPPELGYVDRVCDPAGYVADPPMISF